MIPVAITIIHYMDRRPTLETDPEYYNLLLEQLSSMAAQNKVINVSLKFHQTAYFNAERTFSNIESAEEWKEFIVDASRKYSIPLAGVDIHNIFIREESIQK
jgi:ABC-type uncharacterized transport system YnjBCD substrate-binding protein